MCYKAPHVSRRHWRRSLAGMVTVIVAVTIGVSSATGQATQAHHASAQQCPDSQFGAQRDPSNPLELAASPGGDPMRGAHLFVDGTRHGAAAGAIAQMLGVDPTSYPDNYSWVRFSQDLSPGGWLYPRLAADPALAAEVAQLAKIAGQEETQNVSLYAQGGGPGAIFSQMQKIICHNMTADPMSRTVPVFSTFLIYPNGQFCPSLSAINGNWSTFKRQVDEMAAGTGRHPAIFLLEIDAVGTSGCLKGAALTAWESDLRYEIEKLTALPHTLVYVEAGAADEDSPEYVAHVIGNICVVGGRNVCSMMRGFYVNGTHFDWTGSEIRYADKVSGALETVIRGRTHQSYVARFVINTAQNGQGPKLNPHPVTQGIEDLCNPTGRGIGRTPTANTSPTYDGRRFSLTDAFLWTGVPGRSHNSNCHPGDAAAGVFDPRFALALASRASDQLGPVVRVVPPPPPLLGRTFDALPVSGIVYVKIPGGQPAADQARPASASAPGRGFVALTAGRSLPMGAEVDARRGSLQVVTATGSAGKTQTGIFGKGLFKLSQTRSGPARGLTTLSLVEAAFKGAPSYAGCPAAGAADVTPGARAARVKSSILQTLHASERGGRFRTRGRYSAATVRGTAWDTTDRCDGTLTVVRQGVVTVRDFARRATVIVRAGHRYLAKAPARRKK